MPTEKRARQKEGRRARLEAERKVEKRRKRTRSSVIVVIVAAVVVGTVYAFTHGGSSSPPPKAKTPQEKVNAVAVKAGCAEQPANSASNPANTLHFSSPPRNTINPSLTYYATIDTTQGPIKAVLNSQKAPVNVNNFIFLSDQGFYHCNPFWRVIPGFMNQTGDPTGTGSGGPGYTITADEYPRAVPSGKHQYPDGYIAMANMSRPHTNQSQFFIMAGQDSQLPPTYTVIGRVIAGQGAVERINKQGNPSPRANGVPPDVINRVLSITITSKEKK